jgi:intracellular sulfur oxidation DsrE/DsrF family protein
MGNFFFGQKIHGHSSGGIMSDLTVAPTPRRRFLGNLAGAAAALGLSGSFASSLEAETIERSADPQLDAWFGRIKGKHKMVFDAPEPNSGMGAIWPRVYLNTITAAYPGEATAVLILRHSAIPLAMNDALWTKYPLGATFHINDGEAPAKRNPYATITNLPLPGLGVTELMKGGVLVGVCDVALTVYSSGVAQQTGTDAATVKKDWVAGLLPGVQIVPSGVMAVARAQELGCAYCFAG